MKAVNGYEPKHLVLLFVTLILLAACAALVIHKQDLERQIETRDQIIRDLEKALGARKPDQPVVLQATPDEPEKAREGDHGE